MLVEGRGFGRVVCLGLVLFALEARANAQPHVEVNTEASPEDDGGADDAAREVFEAGEQAFERGDYEHAHDYFMHAYELSGRPQLLFNAGNAAGHDRRDARALQLYRQYLAEEPEAENRAVVESRIAALERSEEQASEGGNKAWMWITGSAAIVFTGVGIVGRLRANAEYAELEELCSNAPGCNDDEFDGTRVRRWDRVTVSSFIVAGLAVAGFVVSFALRGGEDANEEDELQVGVGPGGVRLRGTF